MVFWAGSGIELRQFLTIFPLTFTLQVIHLLVFRTEEFPNLRDVKLQLLYPYVIFKLADCSCTRSVKVHYFVSKFIDFAIFVFPWIKE